MEYFYATNNVEESLHERINKFIGKGITTNLEFLNTIPKIFTSFEFKNNNIIRYDYIIQKIIKINEKKNLNNDPRWINIGEYNENLKDIINNNKEDKNINDLESIFNLIKEEKTGDEKEFTLNDNVNINEENNPIQILENQSKIN